MKSSLNEVNGSCAIDFDGIRNLPCGSNSSLPTNVTALISLLLIYLGARRESSSPFSWVHHWMSQEAGGIRLSASVNQRRDWWWLWKNFWTSTMLGVMTSSMSFKRCARHLYAKHVGGLPQKSSLVIFILFLLYNEMPKTTPIVLVILFSAFWNNIFGNLGHNIQCISLQV